MEFYCCWGSFLCVTLHEYGHALTARALWHRHRLTSRSLPIGGVARIIGRSCECRVQEFLVAAAGPARQCRDPAGSQWRLTSGDFPQSWAQTDLGRRF